MDIRTLQFNQLEDKLDKILEQTTKTNGKVAELEKFRERVIGVAAGVALVCSVLWALVAKFINFTIGTK